MIMSRPIWATLPNKILRHLQIYTVSLDNGETPTLKKQDLHHNAAGNFFSMAKYRVPPHRGLVGCGGVARLADVANALFAGALADY
ncbi:hypothetical protein ENHY17A_40034 [Moraxellaceae bacterium 17A]|nr:hypothetical protein ENHY17A_40034 [Moraxellaceae bacterium 17A]